MGSGPDTSWSDPDEHHYTVVARDGSGRAQAPRPLDPGVAQIRTPLATPPFIWP